MILILTGCLVFAATMSVILPLIFKFTCLVVNLTNYDMMGSGENQVSVKIQESYKAKILVEFLVLAETKIGFGWKPHFNERYVGSSVKSWWIPWPSENPGIDQNSSFGEYYWKVVKADFP